jgi:uncharacterized protein (DUF983 family)
LLKVNDQCPICQEALHHHRADDLPAYIVIAVVGHVIVTGVVWAAENSTAPIWMQSSILGASTIILSLVLLQPVKGGVIGLQWAQRMHGFEASGGKIDGIPMHRPSERK